MSPSSSESRRSLVGWIIVVLGILIFIILALPGGGSRESPRRSTCTSNLKQIGIALHNYHNIFKRFPPAYIADETGTPMHSWRVLLLPYLEDESLKKLYEQYDFNEPWNGPNNRKLAEKIPSVFRCPSSDTPNKGEPSYLAIVGPQAAWPGETGRSVREITDGTSMTIMVVEAHDTGINWLEPRDLTLEEGSQGINAHKSRLGISSHHQGGANMLFADGSVHFLSDAISKETLRALLTAAGGEVVEVPD